MTESTHRWDWMDSFVACEAQGAAMVNQADR